MRQFIQQFDGGRLDLAAHQAGAQGGKPEPSIQIITTYAALTSIGREINSY